jgi:hypothetical protein
MKQTCAAALCFIQDMAGLLGRDIVQVIQGVWDVVGKRDWTKNPTNAHQVAVEDMKRQSVAEIDAGVFPGEHGDGQT